MSFPPLGLGQVVLTVYHSVVAPAEGDKASVPAQAPEPTELAEAIATITSSTKVYITYRHDARLGP